MLDLFVVAVGEQEMGAQHSQILESKPGELGDYSLQQTAGAGVRISFARALLDFATQFVERSEIGPIIIWKFAQDLVFSLLLLLPALLLSASLQNSLDRRGPRNQKQT